MAEIINMPKLSDTMTVGTLVRWLKNEGDPVKTGDMLAEVETDKATMELESFFDGALLKIFIPAGSQVPIGSPLCAVGKPGETVEAPAGANAAPAQAQAPKAPPPAAAPAPAAAPVPAGTSSAPKPTKAAASNAATPSQGPGTAAAAPAPKSSSAAPESTAPKQEAPASASPAPAAGGRIKISPLARRLASENGIDPSSVTGSGPGGRIVRADILAAEKSGGSRAPAAKGGPLSGQGPIQEEKLTVVSQMRATIARRLIESKVQIPHFYLENEIDAGPLLALRQQLNAALERDGVKLSLNDFILKASAEALRRVPAVNCSWESDPKPAIRSHSAAHVSFAVAIPDGLITPVIRDAQAKSIFAISTEAKNLAKLAKERKLQPAQFTGGTFCVSNLGMMGIDRFSAIINPPNAAILAVGTTVRKPVVVDDRVAVGQRMSLTLSCDHRVVDGAVGAAFLAALVELLEQPALLLI